MTSLVYDETFYSLQSCGSMQSAEIIAPLMMDLVAPKSVIDIGCGVGGWLLEFQRLGVAQILGVDGSHGANEGHLLTSDQFVRHDLSKSFSPTKTFDLAVSLEVAEHLPETRAASFVSDLAACAEVILFSAAIPHQGGIHHVNENWPSYWAGMFKNSGLLAVDVIRPKVWNDARVQWWYAQNMLVYASAKALKSNSALNAVYARRKDSPLDIVHPRKYVLDADMENMSLRRALSGVRLAIRRNLRIKKRNSQR